MHLSNHAGNSKLLTMDLAEAFALQAALTETIRRLTQVTNGAALQGRQVRSFGAGETVDVAFTYEHDKKTYPSSLTLHVLEGVDQ